MYQKQLSKGSSGGKQVADASDQSKKALTGGQRKTKGLLKGKMTNAAGEGAERYFGKSRG